MSITISPDETKNPSGARPTIPEGGTVGVPATVAAALQARESKLGKLPTPLLPPNPDMKGAAAYAQGFAQKCAEEGISPVALLRAASRAG